MYLDMEIMGNLQYSTAITVLKALLLLPINNQLFLLKIIKFLWDQ